MKRVSPGVPRSFIESLPLEGHGCIKWPYATNSAGYGHLRVDGRYTLASRISCERRNGPPPSPRHHAAHSCGKGHDGCVAPWHLSWKTPAENSADMVRHGTRRRGIAVRHLAKLTEKNILEIRRLRGSATQAEIGARFGITQSAVSYILNRKTWGHL